MSGKNVYLAAAIAAGRGLAPTYRLIGKSIAEAGGALVDPQVLDPETIDRGLSDTEIFARDVAALAAADCVIAEVSIPSLGVGFEVARSAVMGHPILALYRAESDHRLSAMIAGCPGVRLGIYRNDAELGKFVQSFVREPTGH